MENTDFYSNLSNVQLFFYDTSKAKLESEDGKLLGMDINSTNSYILKGFLSDEGFTLSLTNNFSSTLERLGGLLAEVGKTFAELKSFIRGGSTHGYITTGLSENQNIMLNAPLMWEGTQPIDFSLTVFQVADNENTIITSYQKILEILSPSMGVNNQVSFVAHGPGLVEVVFFKTSDYSNGRMKMGPCVCTNVSMNINPPYSSTYTPLIGTYRFQLRTTKILVRERISEIFKGQGE